MAEKKEFWIKIMGDGFKKNYRTKQQSPTRMPQLRHWPIFLLPLVTLLHDFPAATALLPAAAPVILLLLVAAVRLLPPVLLLLLAPATTVTPVAVVAAACPLVLPTFVLPVCGVWIWNETIRYCWPVTFVFNTHNTWSKSWLPAGVTLSANQRLVYSYSLTWIDRGH